LAASSRRQSPKCERAEPLAADAQSTMPQRIKWISNHRRKLFGDHKPPPGLREKPLPHRPSDPYAL
jgi:hypothetical protein